VEHGRTPRSNGFSVHCTFQDEEVTIEICDNGTGFSLESPATESPGSRGRGYGIFLMRKLMDVVRFERDGTCVRLVRRHAVVPNEDAKITV
jgi:anti-sigma regulatory factor (Ser/Thr protein kinase)